MFGTEILGASLVALIAVAIAGWLAVFITSRMLEAARAEVERLRADDQPAPRDEKEDASATPASCSRWHAMPGHRIELADTGFYIVLDIRPRQPLYSLFTPEHVMAAYGPNLQMMKGYGEQLAAERLEFAPPAPVAQFWRAAR